MNEPISDLEILLRSLEPELHEGTYVYSSVPPQTDLRGISPIATFLESEGLTVIVAERDAAKANLPILFRAAWITLTVNSDLQAVGLTAAFSTALGNVGISCNVIAGSYHDHIFVPIERAEEAMTALHALQRNAV